MTQPRGPGRPRDPGVDQAIWDAAWQVLVELGPRRLSPERVAEEAGVAVSTVYRRHSNADELLGTLVSSIYNSLTVSDTGTLRGDLLELMASISAAISPTGSRRALIALLAAAEENSALSDLHHAALAAQRERTGPIVTRAIERGELDAHIDPVLVAEMLTAYTAFQLVTSEATSPSMLEAAADVMLNGILRRPT